MNIQYTKFINQYDPVAVSWNNKGDVVLLEFSVVITALYSEILKQVVVELYEDNKINFYDSDGVLTSSEIIPRLDGYQFRGINKNLNSKTGISLLFNPVSDSVGNEWRDVEQYELDFKAKNFLGKKLGIYR